MKLFHLIPNNTSGFITYAGNNNVKYIYIYIYIYIYLIFSQYDKTTLLIYEQF